MLAVTNLYWETANLKMINQSLQLVQRKSKIVKVETHELLTNIFKVHTVAPTGGVKS